MLVNAEQNVQYYLKLKIPLPGHGNDVELDSLPVMVISGINGPMARKEHIPRLQCPQSSGSPLSSEVWLPS